MAVRASDGVGPFVQHGLGRGGGYLERQKPWCSQRAVESLLLAKLAKSGGWKRATTNLEGRYLALDDFTEETGRRHGGWSDRTSWMGWFVYVLEGGVLRLNCGAAVGLDAGDVSESESPTSP
jgi:hypothetical protein